MEGFGTNLAIARARPPAPGPTPHPAPHSPFRALLGETAWQQLPGAVQQRFGRMLAPGESAAFVGEVESTRLSSFGWLTAPLARLVGAPLPLKAIARTAAAVLVTEDAATNAQLWTRIYH
jgi:hypothetical protein